MESQGTKTKRRKAKEEIVYRDEFLKKKEREHMKRQERTVSGKRAKIKCRSSGRLIERNRNKGEANERLKKAQYTKE
jgi:hypothetical protein